MRVGTRKVRYPRKRHFLCRVPKAFSAFCLVRRPMATSVVSSVKPKVSTSTRYTNRNRPSPSLAQR